MKNIFDSHAHYDSKQFDNDRDEILTSLPGKGICAVLGCGSDMATSQLNIKLSERYAFHFAAVGVHPHEAQAEVRLDKRRLEYFLSHERVKALGEIGLDYHYNFSPPALQKKFFAEQLELAIELDMPVVVHDREAHADTLALLQKYRPRGVVHCFSGSAEMAVEILKLGMYIGLGGAVTFNNARKPLEVAAMIPDDRLLIETDAPYMTPVPFRGKRCDSGHIPYIADKLAEVRGCKRDDILRITCDNAARLFDIKPCL